MRRVSSECLVFLVTPDDRAPRVPLVSQDSQVLMARKELGVCKASWDKEDNVDPRAHVVNGDPEDQPENQEQREPQELMGLQVLLAKGVFQDLKGPPASQDQKDHPDHQERMGFQDTLDREVKWVSKARLALQDHLV